MTEPIRRPVWIRHSDFYVERGQIPGQPGPEPSQTEIRRGHWGTLRQLIQYPFILFIKAWRKLISPLYGEVCSFYPSCSAYGLEAVTVHGLIKGSGLTVWRILRCNPFTGGGLDAVPASSRVWPAEEVPEIVVRNHPPLEPEDEN